MAPPPAQRAPLFVPVAYADIGKAPKGLFDAKNFPSDAKVSFSGATTSGVTFTASAVQKPTKVEPTLKALYTAASKKYSIEGNYESPEKVTVTASLNDAAPRLKVVGSVVLPAYADSAKATVEYAFPALHLKSIIGLTASPTLECSAATSYKSLLFGAEAGYSTAKSAITKYTFAAALHGADHQIAATLSDKAHTLKVAYSHTVSPTQTVGAEVVRKLAGGDTAFALAYHRKLDGSLAKFRLDNTGTLNVGYETKLASGEKFSGSALLNSTDLSKPPKYGFALDLV